VIAGGAEATGTDAKLVGVKVQPSPELYSGADSFRSDVDRHLLRVIQEHREHISAWAPEATPLVDELERIVLSGGKRLRPLFCYWGYRAAGAPDDARIVRAGAAVEMLHTGALIHDDLMDRGNLRRGEPTTFRRLGVTEKSSGRNRFGHSAAVLAGDLAQALADELLAESRFPADRIVAAFAHFNRMRIRAVSGEFLDILAHRPDASDPKGSDVGHGDERRARRVAALKTGSYTVVGPLLMGGALAGAGQGVAEALTAYGRPLGEAFQLRDDVLGTFGDEMITGKDRDTDIREGKRTTLMAKAWRMSSPQERRLIEERLGRSDLSSEQVDGVRDVIRGSGALADTVRLIDTLAAEAKSCLAGAPIHPQASRALDSLADLVALRDA
jgi:geranylgeranyl diphosphate synthase type I